VGALLCQSWNDYLEAQVSKDHHLLYDDDGVANGVGG
jgi:hypothetical protein